MGADLEREYQVFSSRLSFGLNFERHRPEAVELPQRPIRKGDKVRVLPERGSTKKGDPQLWQVKVIRKTGNGKVADLELPDAEVGMVKPESDPDDHNAYTVSLYMHKRIDRASILAAVRQRMKGEKASPSSSGGGQGEGACVHQPDLLVAPFENLPLRDALDFYKHERGGTNRLIAGDSLLVMSLLFQKETVADQAQSCNGNAI